MSKQRFLTFIIKNACESGLFEMFLRLTSPSAIRHLLSTILLEHANAHALHKQDASLVFSATSAEKSQKLLRTLSNRDRKRKDSQNEKKGRHERTKTQ